MTNMPYMTLLTRRKIKDYTVGRKARQSHDNPSTQKVLLTIVR